jgi:ATP-dependent helicase HrpA
LALQKDFGWLQKDLRGLARLEPLCAGFCSAEELQATAFENLKGYLLPAQPVPALAEAHFRAVVEQARQRLPGLALQLIDRVEAILNLRQEVLRRWPAPAVSARPRALSSLSQLGAPLPAPRKPAPLAAELDALLPTRFLEHIPFEQLPHIPRYLKALRTRAERAALNPAKDRERAGQLAPFQAALRQLEAGAPKTFPAWQRLAEFRWLLEEYKVSVFAQELGTAVPISPKRLDQHLERLRQTIESEGALSA